MTNTETTRGGLRWGDTLQIGERSIDVTPENWDKGFVEHGDFGLWDIMRPHSWIHEDAEPDTYFAGGDVFGRYRLMAQKGDCNPLLPPATLLTAGPQAWDEAWECIWLAFPDAKRYASEVTTRPELRWEGLHLAFIDAHEYGPGKIVVAGETSRVTDPAVYEVLANRLRAFQQWLQSVEARAKERE